MQLRGILLGTGVLFAATALFHAADNPKLPPPYATPAANNGPRVIPRPSGARLNVPQGFSYEVWAEDFKRPRFMMLGPNNEVILADSDRRPNGTVYVFDKNKEAKKLITGLYQPYGLAYLNGYLYVAESDSVKKYKYDSKAMTAGPGEEIISLKGQDTHHWTRSLLIDRAGKKIYVGVGSASNVSTGEDPRRAAISVYNIDGSDHQIFAAGLRNPIGMRWYPGTDTLWAAVQERDDLGDDLVPDYFTHVQKGGFYGWPYAYIGPNEDPRNKGLRPLLVAKTIVPDVLLGAHVAVLDFVFYTGKQFPAEYQGGAFLCFHGSWNRSMRVGQSIGFIPFKDGKPSGPLREVLTGWMLGPDKREVWGRPVGLLQLPDGSLLISDDGGDKIWHLSYTGK
ncbi:MAG: PQQ-dependent sugar dehydrogenase [Candidatus Sulfopaludibacter sp.]|nr:PQQ-dependent sugar dehydrogenase [Candidatus Sulfopaludibacter sp.]